MVSQRGEQGFQGQHARVVRHERISHNFLGEDIHDRGQENKFPLIRHIGEISHPDMVEVARKSSLQEIREKGCRHPCFLGFFASPAVCTHTK